MPAYPVSGVPEDVIFPYLTYENPSSAFEMGEVFMAVSLWFRTESEAIPNARAQQIAETIGLSGVILPVDGGAIWLKLGSPVSNSPRYDAAPNVKLRVLNITREDLTLN